MNIPLAPDDIRDLLPAYALGMVDPAERAQIEAALVHSSELQAELAELQVVVGQLGTAVPQIAPPANLGKRLMEKAARPSQSAGRDPYVRWRYYALAAAAVLVIFFGVAVWSTLNDEEQPDRISHILENEQSVWINLAGSQGFEDIGGAFVIDPTRQWAVLQVKNLQVLDPEKTYQLWLVRDDERRSGLLFRPDVTDPMLLVDLPEDFETFQVMGVTIEPQGGSPGPTSDPVFVAVLNE
jgi:anti-sigma-K factor RskA